MSYPGKEYQQRLLVAYEAGRKAGANERLDYLRKMAMTQDYIAYDCYVEAKDWADKTFGIAASVDCSAQNNENPHPEYQEYIELVDGILAEERKRL